MMIILFLTVLIQFLANLAGRSIKNNDIDRHIILKQKMAHRVTATFNALSLE